ncbi:MAG TPA: hypothetical protein VFQ77_05370 [Pseudonocardiaceae bacterium]|nr:hypothetical protein [Pseudonocardiaceae bacterium]
MSRRLNPDGPTVLMRIWRPAAGSVSVQQLLRREGRAELLSGTRHVAEPLLPSRPGHPEARDRAAPPLVPPPVHRSVPPVSPPARHPTSAPPRPRHAAAPGLGPLTVIAQRMAPRHYAPWPAQR